VQRRRGRSPRIPATRALTSDDAERAAAEAELVPTDEM
jgi:hypothetical protein